MFSLLMNFMTWNYQGALCPDFRRALKNYIFVYRLSLLVLVEPRISGVKGSRVIKRLSLPLSHRVVACGLSGDI